MTIHDEITIIANQLANAGNKPTVALIKAKLKKQVALPVIISTLKVWQHDPTLISTSEEKVDIKEEAKTKAKKIDSTDKYLQNITDELAQMKLEIIELKQMINQLIKQNQLNRIN